MRGTSDFSGLRETMFAGIRCASRDATELGQTHRGAEWRHSPVSGTDGQVVEGNGLPIQFDILPDPKHTLHRRDHKLPWKAPKQVRVSRSCLLAPSLQPAAPRVSGAAEAYVILGGGGLYGHKGQVAMTDQSASLVASSWPEDDAGVVVGNLCFYFEAEFHIA